MNQMMKVMNGEIRKVVNKVKAAQAPLQALLKNKTWVEDARKYVERQGKEVRKLFSADVSKLKAFLEKEKKELGKFQKQIPGEVKKIRKFVSTQKKEFEKLLTNVKRTGRFKMPASLKAKARVKKSASSTKAAKKDTTSQAQA